MEIIRNITTARDLLQALNDAPDYMLDQPVVCIHEDTNVAFELNMFECIDLINDGNRETILRVSGEGDAG